MQHVVLAKDADYSFSKQRLGEARLADDALESAATEGIVERYRDSDCGPFRMQLHDSVTAALAHGFKSVAFENLAGFGARQDSQLTQPAPQLE
jgi:hypothetical protein